MTVTLDAGGFSCHGYRPWPLALRPPEPTRCYRQALPDRLRPHIGAQTTDRQRRPVHRP